MKTQTATLHWANHVIATGNARAAIHVCNAVRQCWYSIDARYAASFRPLTTVTFRQHNHQPRPSWLTTVTGLVAANSR